MELLGGHSLGTGQAPPEQEFCTKRCRASSSKVCENLLKQEGLTGGAHGNWRTLLWEEWVIPALWAADSTGSAHANSREQPCIFMQICAIVAQSRCFATLLSYLWQDFTLFSNTNIRPYGGFSYLAESNQEKGWGGFYCSCGRFW